MKQSHLARTAAAVLSAACVTAMIAQSAGAFESAGDGAAQPESAPSRADSPLFPKAADRSIFTLDDAKLSALDADVPAHRVAPDRPVNPLTPVPATNGDRVIAHLRGLQQVADRHNGDRSHGRPGYRASVDFVKAELDKAGYQTTLHEFTANGQKGWNVVADWPGGDPNSVLAIGAHLDGVPGVAAADDNGSGSAAILETALTFAAAKAKPEKHVRFIWFGGEELIMKGSQAYVKDMTAQDRRNMFGYLNFDMVGSPNPGYFVYDADNSDGGGAGRGPAGSEYFEQVLEGYYKAKNIPTRGEDFDGYMDYGPFIQAGIPAGGMISYQRTNKTAEHARLWGGTAGAPFNPCYHEKCDTIDNMSFDALKINTQAIMHTVWTAAKVGGGDVAPTPEQPAQPQNCKGSDAPAAAIRDRSRVERSVTLNGCQGLASAKATVAVDISHTYVGDLRVSLVGPSGRTFILSDQLGGSSDDIKRTFTVDVSSENASGSWKLVVEDVARGDVGTLNSWSINVAG